MRCLNRVFSPGRDSEQYYTDKTFEASLVLKRREPHRISSATESQPGCGTPLRFWGARSRAGAVRYRKLQSELAVSLFVVICTIALRR